MNIRDRRHDRDAEFSFSRIDALAAFPLFPHLSAICEALENSGAAVLCADPGSGKSSLVPLSLMEKDDAQNRRRRIIVLEPRRATALAIASRMAELLGEETGERVGYSVRLERKVSAKTRIEVVTEGLLVRRMEENPELPGVSTLIFDEFHERSIHTDLAFAFALDLRRMGSPLRILVMSATMDAGRIASFIDSVEGRPENRLTPVIDCPGRLFPVEVSYRPLPRRQALGKECAAAVQDIAGKEAAGTSGAAAPQAGDILVFLPGRREIAHASASLMDGGMDRDFEILPLHGSLPLKEQRRVIAPRGFGRRIILSTNVAETGLTIPGIGLVIDSGYARIERFHLPSGMNRLSLEPISKNSADQRAGRAGRLGPGRCIRLWRQDEPRPEETDSEIRRIDLSAAVLDCLLWGVRSRDGLPWLETPPQAAWNSALDLLWEMGAAGRDGKPTETGKALARLGLEPRLGRLCLAGLGQDAAGQPRDGNPAGAGNGRLASLACTAAAILSARDGSGIENDADFSRRLELIRKDTRNPWAAQVRENAADLCRRLGVPCRTHWTAGDEADIGELLASAFPDRIARRRDAAGSPAPDSGEGIFRFSSGREGRIKGALARARWLCGLEVDAGERLGFIRLAAPVSQELALEILEKQALVEKRIEWKGLIPRTINVTRAGRLVLSEERRPSLREELLPALRPLLEEKGLAVLPWDEENKTPRRFLERIRFFEKHGGAAETGAASGPRPAWTDEALTREAADWLGPFVRDGAGGGRAALIDGQGLLHALENRFGWEKTAGLNRLVPDRFQLPGGGKKRIDYSSGEPVLLLRLQDAFGISGVCEILSIPITFHLLSPAGRPVQITRDPGKFWSGSYREVRKEMKGRYPKHHWPEIP
ncbi:MAG: ATP-dependent helicase HrpB [Treponema sp.]|nr:ATP-dependent helicase HrpB [Treponema sp.]